MEEVVYRPSPVAGMFIEAFKDPRAGFKFLNLIASIFELIAIQFKRGFYNDFCKGFIRPMGEVAKIASPICAIPHVVVESIKVVDLTFSHYCVKQRPDICRELSFSIIKIVQRTAESVTGLIKLRDWGSSFEKEAKLCRDIFSCALDICTGLEASAIEAKAAQAKEEAEQDFLHKQAAARGIKAAIGLISHFFTLCSTLRSSSPAQPSLFSTLLATGYVFSSFYDSFVSRPQKAGS